jgi:hypothetical protein
MTLSSLLLATLIGCGGGEEQKPADAEGQAPAPAAEAAPPAALKLDELKQAAQNITLVPSPAEMQKALEKGGIASKLDALVPARTLKMDTANKDVVAVRTGLVLADALLTVKSAPEDKLIERLNQVKAGLATLGAGTDIAATIDDLTARIGNKSMSRDELVKELDDLHGAVIPEIEYEAGPQVVPLIQAGSWLGGSNLVAAAIVEANKPDAGTSMLRQPEVCDYFLKYVAIEGGSKAPDEVVQQLNATLTKLKEIASKPSLTIEDVKEVKSQTDTVLGLL